MLKFEIWMRKFNNYIAKQINQSLNLYYQEIDRGGSITAHAALDQTMVVLLDPSDDPDDILRQNRNREKQYMFDYVFDAIATQEEVYEKTTKGILRVETNLCAIGSTVKTKLFPA